MGRKQPTIALRRRPGNRPAVAELLLEIGTEELPYQFIQPALRALADSAERLLKEHRLSHGAIRTLATPRRLVLAVDALANRQTPTVKEAMGPSKAVAFDAGGQATRAAIGFAGSQGLAVTDLEIRLTPRGEYVFAVKREPGRQTQAVLADVLPGVIGGLSFPKTMRWNATGMRFARPIRWLLALYDGQTVKVQIGGLSTGKHTRGHRHHTASRMGGQQGLPVKHLASYLRVLERHHVIADQDRRRTMILAQLTSLARSAAGLLHRDEDLLQQAVFSTEDPHAILGQFNPQYLSLPKEILMTAMKEQQGFFSLMQSDGSLLPRFIAVTNMKLPDMDLIRRGNERVLAARLADAKFFFDEDRKSTLADRVEKLKGVTFHQGLGSLYQKRERVIALAMLIGSLLSFSRDTINACRQAAELCKADLLTGIVGEFPSLQGVMGGEYARHDGEPEVVCLAIREQYLPPSMEGELPKTDAGKVLSLADRLDTLLAFFHVGIVPTGSEDPLGLRRHATAIVRIILEGGLRLNLMNIVDHARELLDQQGFKTELPGKGANPLDFIADRLRYYGRTAHGLGDDIMEALLKRSGVGAFDLVDLLLRMRALRGITGSPDFDPLIVGFKRAHRLVEKEQWGRDPVDPARFQHGSEKTLYQAVQEVRKTVPASIDRGQYTEALEALVQLKPAIDGFFLGVMVNAEDPALRANRLSLLAEVDSLFMGFADFSQLQHRVASVATVPIEWSQRA